MAIELSNILFQYSEQPEHRILDIPSWKVSTGEKVFIHGPSGSGKSTLLSVISGLQRPNRGQVSILGSRLDTLSARKRDRFRAQHIGYVFQQFNLIPYLNTLDNILLANQFSQAPSKSASMDDIKALLLTLNITKKDWDKPTHHLSMGQQQRIAIARALINKPQVFIADEPTSSLDSNNRESFMELLLSTIAEHPITLIFVSHDLSLASHFHRVESLNDINQCGESVSC
ncbi:MAG: ABC transporter ATP-binding protein [Pseudomonadota bacterium]